MPTDEEFRICVYHREHKAIMERNEKDIATLWEAIDKMRVWVVAGCASMVLFLLGVVLQFLLKLLPNVP